MNGTTRGNGCLQLQISAGPTWGTSEEITLRHIFSVAVSGCLHSRSCFVHNIHKADITADLPRIQCPTLVITTEGSALGSVEDTRAWQTMIPRSELLVLPGDSYHVAASDADRCAEETLAFITRSLRTPN